jgi:hypothetical protein
MWLSTRIYHTDSDEVDRLKKKGNIISDKSKPKEMTMFLGAAL